jgi:hypothetical protein
MPPKTSPKGFANDYQRQQDAAGKDWNERQARLNELDQIQELRYNEIQDKQDGIRTKGAFLLVASLAMLTLQYFTEIASFTSSAITLFSTAPAIAVVLLLTTIIAACMVIAVVSLIKDELELRSMEKLTEKEINSKKREIGKEFDSRSEEKGKSSKGFWSEKVSSDKQGLLNGKGSSNPQK